MRITIICVGKIKEKYWTDAIAEYTKRLSRYVKLDIVEVKDEKTSENLSDTEEKLILFKEAERIFRAIPVDSYICTLEIMGGQRSSEELAKEIKKLEINGKSHISFIIGGSLGLHEDIINRADMHLSFSKMTFPHQMMRVVLLEQIYRAYKINSGEPYHK